MSTPGAGLEDFLSGFDNGQYVDYANLEQETALGVSERDYHFPTKLHYMLSELERDGLSHIVSWQAHGRCFIINDMKLFVEFLIPSWFRMTKYPSFQRQLNLYGFTRITSGQDKGAYYHALFLRGKIWLTRFIQRYKVKGTKVRRPGAPATEPDFYSGPYQSVGPDGHPIPLVSPIKPQTPQQPKAAAPLYPSPRLFDAPLRHRPSTILSPQPRLFDAPLLPLPQLSDGGETSRIQRIFMASAIPSQVALGPPFLRAIPPPNCAIVLLDAQKAQITSQLLVRRARQIEEGALVLEGIIQHEINARTSASRTLSELLRPRRSSPQGA